MFVCVCVCAYVFVCVKSAVNIHSYSFASLIRCFAGQVLRRGCAGRVFLRDVGF